MAPRSYYWFDTPDGEDLMKKTNFAMKIGFLGGFPSGILHACLHPPKDLKTVAFRYAQCVVPAMGTAVIFAVTSQMLCKHFPQRDPRISYFIAGMASGSAVGAAFRSPLVGSVAGFYFGLIAVFAQDLHISSKDKSTVLGKIPRVSINDDLLLASDFRGQPPMSLPPPAARPALAPSTLYSYF